MEQELELLRKRWPDAEYRADGHWFRIPRYELPNGWNRTVTEIAFQPQAGYPGIPPYGFFVPVGITFSAQRPDNYSEPAPTQPPFAGTWGVFSWAVDGDWRPTADPSSGANLFNWALGFATRFREGK